MMKLLIFCLSVLAVIGVPSQSAFAQSQQPDILIVLCDDFNPFYTGYAGDPDVRTPNLDTLARDSGVFSRCYSASAVCMPARTSLITGLYPHNTGCWGNASELFVSPRLTSMFGDFKQAGYTNAMIGKTHWFAGSGFKDQFASKKNTSQASASTISGTSLPPSAVGVAAACIRTTCERSASSGNRPMIYPNVCASTSTLPGPVCLHRNRPVTQ